MNINVQFYVRLYKYAHYTYECKSSSDNVEDKSAMLKIKSKNPLSSLHKKENMKKDKHGMIMILDRGNINSLFSMMN